ncbi:helix-turn-helix domain-containing protein [Pontibacter litorisediminis]|uniref:helix-turn-helix domain-containing protein n=1 Tax=Pontibacter litorisediminis TaxID=1846260 RepID=UPI0023ECB15B|nr:helix-turn-helix domain-containing protein [Pontibacter litorisediminis]
MSKQHLPLYQIQDFNALAHKERYFYASSLAAHLQEHLFTQQPHKHTFYIILFITQGSGTHTIDFKKYEVKPNMFFFMVPGQVHSWVLSEDADGFVVFFTPEFYLKEFSHKKLFDYPFFNPLLNHPVLTVSEEETHGLALTFQALQKEYAGNELMRNQMLSRHLDILLISLTRLQQTKGTKAEVKGGELSLLQNFEDLVEQHYKAHLPVTFYAEQLHVTTRHLKEICKGALGKTTNELVQDRLSLEAQRLLVHSELTASQIAAELGYFDAAYFFRFFKKHTGLTPEQFRNLNR